MSYAQVMAIFPGEKFYQLEELPNSWGLHPLVWNNMTKKYGIPDRDYTAMSKLCWDQRVPEHQRAVLIMTFDFSYIKRKKFKKAANDIRRFFEDFKIPADYANHWPTVIDILESNPEIPAIGFHSTSVAQGELWDKPSNGEFDWSKTDSVYKVLKKNIPLKFMCI
jgi:hypothetical protein